MHIRTIAAGICFALLLSGCHISGDSEGKFFGPTSGPIIEETSTDWGIVMYDNYHLVNNVWNKGASTGSYIQKVFTEILNANTVVGWQWDWSNTSLNVVAYPEIVIGDKAWDAPLGITTPLPIKAGSADIVAKFNTHITADGTYNMAFSIWGFTNTADPKTSISHEIMIWVLNRGLTPAGTKTYTTNVDGVNFNVYVRENHEDNSGGTAQKWIYIAFEPESDILNGPLHLDDFIDFLSLKELISPANYLSSIELGNEVVTGKGTVEIENYSVIVTPR